MSVRRLSRNALAGVAQVLVSAVIMFELYRFLVRELGPAQIGAWSLVLASASVTRLAELGFGGGIVRFVAGDLGAGNRVRAASTTGIAAGVIAAAVGLACVVGWFALSPVLSRVVREPALLPFSLELLPWALMGLWCGSIANVFLCALDACQRSSLRAGVLIGASALQLMAAYIVVPGAGLSGLGPIYLFQSLATLAVSLGLARAALGQPFRSWLSLDRVRLGELFRYGGSLQVATLGQLLFDPITKAFMAQFGGLAATGYYEMANRAITQFRAVIVAAYQALVPYLATKAGSAGLTPSEVRAAYLPAHRLLFVAGTPYYALLATVLPLLLTLWLGSYNAQFQLIGFICLVGWYANTLTVPAYMLCLAVGRVRWVMWSHLAMGALNVALSWVGGEAFGATGVVVGAMSSLILGSLVVQAALQAEYRFSRAEMVPAASAPLLAACAGAFSWAVWVSLVSSPAGSHVWAIFGATATFVVCSVLFVRHPLAREILARVRTAA